MDLKQIKADRANGVLISSYTWDAVLDRAIELEAFHNSDSSARNFTLEKAATIAESVPIKAYASEPFQLQVKTVRLTIAEAIRARKSDSTAIGKPDGERA